MKESVQKEISELVKRAIFETIYMLIVDKNFCEILKSEKFVKSKIYVDRGLLNKECADLIRLVVKETFNESLQ
jgi:hypothetical protein